MTTEKKQRWSESEDAELARLYKQGMKCSVMEGYFDDRTASACQSRIDYLRKSGDGRFDKNLKGAPNKKEQVPDLEHANKIVENAVRSSIKSDAEGIQISVRMSSEEYVALRNLLTRYDETKREIALLIGTMFVDNLQ